MIRFVIFGIVFYLIYRVVADFLRSRGDRSDGSGNDNLPARGEDLVEDPCCHTYIPVSNARRYLYDGRTVYFCSQECLEKFRSQRGC